MKMIAIMSVLLLSAPPAFAEVLVINDQQYVGDDGFLHIVGEVINDTSAPINQTILEATLYDEDGHITSVKQANSLINTIMPGMRGPFDLVVGGSEVESVHSYELAVSYKIGAPKNQAIDIVSSEMLTDNHDNLMIKGAVTNRGEITANIVSVVATVYDRDGSVAAVSRVHPEPDYLRVNSEAFFLVPIPDKAQTSEISDYLLVAESEEYAAVPEFSSGMSILLAGSAFAYVVASRYFSRITASPTFAMSQK